MKTCVVETLYHYNHCLLRECPKPLMTIYWVYRYYLKLANHHNWGLPLGLLPSTTLSTLVHLLLSIPLNVPFYYSCLFLNQLQQPYLPQPTQNSIISDLVLPAHSLNPPQHVHLCGLDLGLLLILNCPRFTFMHEDQHRCCIWHLQLSLLTQLLLLKKELPGPSHIHL